ncbi:MAG: hypothetical protein ABW095_08165 [Candidatus Thiodiazotropha sp.]
MIGDFDSFVNTYLIHTDRYLVRARHFRPDLERVRNMLVPVTRFMNPTVLVMIWICLVARTGFAEQSLEQAASDPTASLISVQVENHYTGSYHGSNDTSNTALVRAAMPYKTGQLSHISRATLPYVTDSRAGESGLGDLILFDLVVFEQAWGRWGLGPVAQLPTASNDQIASEKWALGPAFGFVANQDGMLWGLFNQNLFTVAGDDDRKDVDVSIVQPIFDYDLPGSWSLSASDMNITYDWNRNAWSSLPLGVKLANFTKLGTTPVQLSGAYEYDFQDRFNGKGWTINLTAKFIFPL